MLTIFISIVTICISYFKNCLFICLFVDCMICFLLLIFFEFLVDSSGIVTNTSAFEGCFFTYPIVSFAVQNIVALCYLDCQFLLLSLELLESFPMSIF